MAVQPKISNAAARGMVDALTALLDAGSAEGYVNVYDGTRPSGVDVAVTTQNVLVTFPLADPAFDPSTDANPNALATANAIAPAVAIAAGTPTWFRAFDSNDLPIEDGNVGTSSADMIVDAATISLGQTVTINSWTITQPEG